MGCHKSKHKYEQKIKDQTEIKSEKQAEVEINLQK
jgi:hypothetical protein